MRLASTEQRNPRSRGLDKKSTLEILRTINREDEHVAIAVRRELPQIARAVDAIVFSLTNGGKLFYVGAGTSGRLAALDAAECPPTFGTRAESIQALIAGGARTMRGANEAAEDSATSGARDLAAAGVSHRDVVVGLAASGTTPYVLGAIDVRTAARKRHDRDHVEPAVAVSSKGKDCDRPRDGPGGDRRFDAPESWHRPENGAQLAFNNRDGAPWSRL